MACKTCEKLLAAYQISVRVYSEATGNLRGATADDLKCAMEDAERLHGSCREAHVRLLEHWRTDHDAARAAGDKF